MWSFRSAGEKDSQERGKELPVIQRIRKTQARLTATGGKRSLIGEERVRRVLWWCGGCWNFGVVCVFWGVWIFCGVGGFGVFLKAERQ